MSFLWSWISSSNSFTVATVANKNYLNLRWWIIFLQCNKFWKYFIRIWLRQKIIKVSTNPRKKIISKNTLKKHKIWDIFSWIQYKMHLILDFSCKKKLINKLCHGNSVYQLFLVETEYDKKIWVSSFKCNVYTQFSQHW